MENLKNLLIFLTIINIVVSASWAGAEGGNPKEDSAQIVITAGEIKKMNVRTVVELLNQIPGVDAGEHSVSLRGSYMVRVLLDGRPINDHLSGHRAVKWNLVSLNDIEKIEIYKGGGAVAFGDDTSGGVISITTKKIKGFHGYLEALGGKLDTQSYNFNIRQDINPFGIGLSAGWDKSDGFRKNGDKDKKRVGTKISYSPQEKHVFDLSLDWAKEDRGIPGLPAFPTPRARSENESFGSSLLCKLGRLKNGTHFSRFERKNTNPDRGLYTTLKSWSLKEDVKSNLSL
ncbi:MAG: TonB-dependent receptor plug domain-containing protein, partial [Deltaproteobacteria bacterium]|nr:TonB-dependent receptor plug domain-containing protein [Deltaproteobacteria bacterium]